MVNIISMDKNKKQIAFWADGDIADRFYDFLNSLKEKFGQNIGKGEAIEFLMEHSLDHMKPKEFLALYHAHKAEKFSKG
jgi:predicted helicase